MMPLSWQKLLECEFCSPAPEPIYCSKCKMATLSARRRWVARDPPKCLATTLNRMVVSEDFAGEKIETYTQLPVSFREGLMLPLWYDESVEYVRYVPVSVVCHLGEDGNGHYVIYNFHDGQITMISDTIIRPAEPSDIEIMENRSALIFWSAEGFDAEVPFEPLTEIIHALDQIADRTKHKKTSDDLSDEECRVIADIRPKKIVLRHTPMPG